MYIRRYNYIGLLQILFVDFVNIQIVSNNALMEQPLLTF